MFEYEDDLFLKEKTPSKKDSPSHNFNYLCALQSIRDFETAGASTSTDTSDKYEENEIE